MVSRRVVMGLQTCGFCGVLPRRRRRNGGEDEDRAKDGSELSPSHWNLFIRLKTLEAATDGFSDSNRLGQGGFGPVYKVQAPSLPLHLHPFLR